MRIPEATLLPPNHRPPIFPHASVPLPRRRPGSRITALGVSTTPPDVLCFGTKDGRVHRLDDAQDGDPAPADVGRSEGFPGGAHVGCIAADPAEADPARVVFSNHGVPSVFSTQDGETGWSHVSENLG